jgi:hypothetical protein
MSEAVYWSCDLDEEELRHQSIEDAVEAWADLMDGPLPETVEVYGFKRVTVTSLDYARPLELLLETLDEDHGGDEPTNPTPAMLEAEKAFLAVVRAEYVSWACEHCETVTVRVADHVPEDWTR